MINFLVLDKCKIKLKDLQYTGFDKNLGVKIKICIIKNTKQEKAAFVY